MDEDLLEQLYRQYYSPALLYALSLCGDRNLAEDLTPDYHAVQKKLRKNRLTMILLPVLIVGELLV